MVGLTENSKATLVRSLTNLFLAEERSNDDLSESSLHLQVIFIVSAIRSGSAAADEAADRKAEDEQKAGVAVIIQSNFSAAAFTPDQTTHVKIYQESTLTIGPSIVRDLVSHYLV